MNKIWRNLAIVTFAAVPLAALASCESIKKDGGNKNSNNSEHKRLLQPNDGKIKILSSFSSGGKPTKALTELLSVYNKTQKQVEGFMPISIVQNPSGYAGASKDIQQKVNSKDVANFYNMTFNYANVISFLSDNELDFQINSEVVGTNAEIRAKFEEGFINSNDRIGGTKKDSVYMLPSQVSGVNTSFNSPVLGYIISSAVVMGGATITTDETAKKFYDVLFAKAGFSIEKKKLKMTDKGKNQYDNIKKLWGDFSGNEFNRFTFDKNTFTNLKSILDFAIRAQKSFAHSKDKVTNEKCKKLRIFGIDDVASLLYLVAFSKAEGNFDKYIIRREDKKGFISFNIEKFLTDANSEEKTLFKDVLNLLIEPMNERAIFVGGGGVYASNQLREHQIAFSIGSTAGYRFNHDGEGGYAVEGKKNDKEGNPVNVIISRANPVGEIVLNAIKNIQDVTNSDAIASWTFGRHTNHIFKSTTKAKKLNYQVILKNVVDDDKVAKFLEEAKNPIIAIYYGKTPEEKDLKTPGDVLVIDAINSKGEGKKYEKEVKLVMAKNTKVVGEKSLQESELLSNQFEGKYDKDSKIAPLLVQGPSLLGIKANPWEDKATRLFMKFLLSETKFDFTIDEKTTNNTPLRFFAQESGYIVPLKDIFNEPIDKYANSFVKDIIKGFKEVADGSKTKKLFSEPIDSKTDEIREKIRSVISANIKILSNSASNTISLDKLFGAIQRVS